MASSDKGGSCCGHDDDDDLHSLEFWLKVGGHIQTLLDLIVRFHVPLRDAYFQIVQSPSSVMSPRETVASYVRVVGHTSKTLLAHFRDDVHLNGVFLRGWAAAVTEASVEAMMMRMMSPSSSDKVALLVSSILYACACGGHTGESSWTLHIADFFGRVVHTQIARQAIMKCFMLSASEHHARLRCAIETVTWHTFARPELYEAFASSSPTLLRLPQESSAAASLERLIHNVFGQLTSLLSSLDRAKVIGDCGDTLDSADDCRLEVCLRAYGALVSAAECLRRRALSSEVSRRALEQLQALLPRTLVLHDLTWLYRNVLAAHQQAHEEKGAGGGGEGAESCCSSPYLRQFEGMDMVVLMPRLMRRFVEVFTLTDMFHSTSAFSEAIAAAGNDDGDDDDNAAAAAAADDAPHQPCKSTTNGADAQCPSSGRALFLRELRQAFLESKLYDHFSWCFDSFRSGADLKAMLAYLLALMSPDYQPSGDDSLFVRVCADRISRSLLDLLMPPEMCAVVWAHQVDKSQRACVAPLFDAYMQIRAASTGQNRHSGNLSPPTLDFELSETTLNKAITITNISIKRMVLAIVQLMFRDERNIPVSAGEPDKNNTAPPRAGTITGAQGQLIVFEWMLMTTCAITLFPELGDGADEEEQEGIADPTATSTASLFRDALCTFTDLVNKYGPAMGSVDRPFQSFASIVEKDILARVASPGQEHMLELHMCTLCIIFLMVPSSQQRISASSSFMCGAIKLASFEHHAKLRERGWPAVCGDTMRLVISVLSRAIAINRFVIPRDAREAFFQTGISICSTFPNINTKTKTKYSVEAKKVIAGQIGFVAVCMQVVGRNHMPGFFGVATVGFWEYVGRQFREVKDTCVAADEDPSLHQTIAVDGIGIACTLLTNNAAAKRNVARQAGILKQFMQTIKTLYQPASSTILTNFIKKCELKRGGAYNHESDGTRGPTSRQGLRVLVATSVGMAFMDIYGSADFPVFMSTAPSAKGARHRPLACVVCGKAFSHSLCGGCRMARYCGVECQKKDWHAPAGGHRMECADLRNVLAADFKP